MTRILFLSNIPTPYQLDFLRVLAGSADVLGVFLWGRELNRDWDLEQKPWFRVLGSSRDQPDWTALRAAVEEFRPMHVLVGGYRLPLSRRLRWYCATHGIGYYYWLERPLPASGLRAAIRRLVWVVTLPLARQVFCIGKGAVAAYGPYCRRTINLPYSIDSARYALRQGTAQRPLKCLYIGQYIDRKGVRALLEAFIGIAPEQATLTLVGSGELKAEVAEAAARHSHIRDRGFVEPGDLPNLIAEHDLLLAPSRHDGWAVVVAEAMVVGLPVISTAETGAFAELAQWEGGARTGTICDVDAEAIRQAVLGYVGSPERIAREGANGRQVVLASPAESRNATRVLLDAINQS